MFRKIRQDRRAMVVGPGAAQGRAARTLATVLSSILVLMLGVALVPASAAAAQGSTAAHVSDRGGSDRGGSDRDSTTWIIGFASTPTTITVGDTVRDNVSIWPRAERTIEVQARRAGSSTWVRTSTSGRSTRAGDFAAVYQPTLGVWQYRLVVKASHSAREAISATRTITAKALTPPKDTTAPGRVTGLSVWPGSSTDSSVSLHWTNPTDADFTGVMIRRLEGSTAPTLTTGTLVRDLIDDVPYIVDVSGVNGGTKYTYALFAHDGVPNYAAGTKVTYTTTGTPRDLTVPAPVTRLTATTPSATSIRLTWTNPADADFTGVIIRRAAGATAPTYTSGVLVTDTAKAARSFTDTGLIAGGPYSYAAFSHDAAGNHAAAVTVTATLPVPPPSVQPTAVLSFTSVGQVVDFDASRSTAVTPKTLATGTLNYGDGIALAPLSAASGWSATHTYAAAGSYQVTLTVTDSAGAIATTVMTVTVLAVPTVTLTGPTAPVTVGTPVVFTLATTGSPIGEWTVWADPWTETNTFYFSDSGTPPGTVTYAFTDIGTYTVSFTFKDYAGHLAETSMEVTVVP